jgi:hypothetical protein
MDGWVGGWVEVKAVLSIDYSNQKIYFLAVSHYGTTILAGPLTNITITNLF